MEKQNKKLIIPGNRKWIVFVSVVLCLLFVFLIYTSQYYHSEKSAYSALQSDEAVSVIETDYGWLFDGPSETDAMIFYPGAKVEETAYAPLLHLIAEQGMDVCLVRMPFHLPILNGNKADRVFQTHDYKRWYIGGHSLGGTMAAFYASGHSEQLNGVILLAAYTTKSLNGVPAISFYGTRDGVLNMEKMKESEQYLSEDSKQYVIEGGNHAQFGNYGKQYGDGTADISSEEQQRITAEFILQNRE